MVFLVRAKSPNQILYMEYNMSVIVIGMDMPTNCFHCSLDTGEWRLEQDPHIYCRYTKTPVPYSEVPTDHRLPCCKLINVEGENSDE